MTDFSYKKYSLENLEKWMSDALLSSEATPQEIYDVIKGVVDEEYHYFKHQTGHCYDLLALLNGHSNLQEQYSEEELNAMCDKAASDQEKEKYCEYNLREAEYYNKRAELDVEYEAIMAAGGYEWTPATPKDKVVKWQLPVETDDTSGEYYIQFPDDLMEAANLKEGDMVEWVDRGDGSYLLKKV